MPSLVWHLLTREARFDVLSLWGSTRKRLWIEKWREANLFVTPWKQTYYHAKSRAAPAHARSAFLRFGRYEEVPEGGFESKKVKRRKLVCDPKKTNILPWQVSCGTRSRAKRVLTFSPLWGSTRRRSQIKKVKEKQTCLLFQENAAGTLGSVNWHVQKQRNHWWDD